MLLLVLLQQSEVGSPLLQNIKVSHTHTHAQCMTPEGLLHVLAALLWAGNQLQASGCLHRQASAARYRTPLMQVHGIAPEQLQAPPPPGTPR